MNIKDKLICASYILIALVALPATWINNLAFMTQPSNASFADFFHAVYVNAAASSLTNDLILVSLAMCIFMAIEGIRIGIRYFWLYIIMSAIVAVSVMFPLFLLARHIKIAKELSLQDFPTKSTP
ncbi:putative membrane protein [Calothrix sp. NIES-4101]|nr:putative membrane protein [Calothrix sp. NIES-4101]